MFRPAELSRYAAIGVLALFAAACDRQQSSGTVAVADATTPDAAVSQSIAALRDGDFNRLVSASVPAARLEQAKTRWMNEIKDEEISDEDRANFAETLGKLTAPDAEAQMLAEIRPQLEQFQGEMKAQLPAMVAMGKGFILSSINESQEIAAENKPQITNLVNALGTWAESGEFASVDRAEDAISAITAAARQIPVKTLDELHALDFNGMMNVVGIGFGGLKGALKAYDIDLDAALAGARVETVNQTGDEATVRVNYELLGVPLSYDTKMVRVDGQWYGKDAIEGLSKLEAGQDSSP